MLRNKSNADCIEILLFNSKMYTLRGYKMEYCMENIIGSDF